MSLKFDMLDGEYWWGGSVGAGELQPFNKDSDYNSDQRVWTLNQTMPMYVSSKGRYIWCDKPFKSIFKDGTVEIICDEADPILVEAGTCLKDAYTAVMKEHFPFDGKELPENFFRTPQYNSWMEFTYHPTQKGILEYAHAIIDHGYKPGILMIDEGWHGRYGKWEFDPLTFPDPKAMVKELHDMGFTVMLWVCPWVCPDGQDFIMQISPIFNKKNAKDIFIRNKQGKVGLFEWWNGYSAMLDMTNPSDFEFLDSQLQALVNDIGIDGFKFDGGNAFRYHPNFMQNGEPREEGYNPHEKNMAWFKFGTRFKYHEYKDSFMSGGKNCIQRLSDRRHSWTEYGIITILPSAIVQGLTGHPFICPDMIGGGDWSCVYGDIDEELFVRMAQVSTFMPMMQYSWAPWNALSEANQKIVLEQAKLHEKVADEIIALVKDSETSGQPILRNLEYNDPGHGYEKIVDEFMLGEDILVAPVVTEKTYKRTVTFPAGQWKDEDGNIYDGNRDYEIDAPIEKLPWFRRVK